MTFSGHWQRQMIQLMDVPGYDDIRMHGGNTSADSTGCCLVGAHKQKDRIYDCHTVLAELERIVQGALDAKEEVWITVA
jgi:hypothetical protein